MIANELTLTVKYIYTPPTLGERDSLGVPIEPDEPEDIDIYEVADEHGSRVILPSISLEWLEEYVLSMIRGK